jgi:hypothetical protein
VAPILDLTVIALAVFVTGSLGLLAWTLGVSAVRSTRRGRQEVVLARLGLARAERRLRADTASIRSSLADLNARLGRDR